MRRKIFSDDGKKILAFKEDILWWTCFFCIWIIFSLASASFLDPDFGWHFKTGEWIWQNWTLPKKDLFSYTMPDYQWRLHSWFSEVIIYRLYQGFGYWGLSFWSGFLVALGLMISFSKEKIGFALWPLFLIVLASLAFAGARPQAISIFLAAFTFRILRKSYLERRWLLVLPFLFLVWSNLHLGFPVALWVIFIILLDDFRRARKGDRSARKYLYLLGGMSLFSLLLVLINPYQEEVYAEIFQEMILGQPAHWRIAEWLPYSDLNLGMLTYAGLFLALSVFFRRKIPLQDKIISYFLLASALLSARFLIFYFIFTLPICIDLLERLYQLAIKKERFWRLWKYRFLFLIIFFSIISFSLVWELWLLTGLYEDKFHPRQAVVFIRESGFPGELFSVYNWGGYLIWRLPEKKVFVDGRMAIWRENDYSAFDEEEELLRGKVDFEPIFKKYSVTTALLPVEKTKENWLSFLLKLISNKPKEFFSLATALKNKGWRVVYEDGIAQVLREPKKE